MGLNKDFKKINIHSNFNGFFGGNILTKLLHQKLKNKEGQLLVEAMVALAVMVVGLLGALTLLINSISYNRFVTEQYIGTYLASEGIEAIKHRFDENIVNNRVFYDGLAPGSYEVRYTPNPSTYNIFKIADLTNPITKSNSFFNFNENAGIYNYEVGGRVTPFKRTIVIKNITKVVNGNNCLIGLQVTSYSNWVFKGVINREIQLEDQFFNWRKAELCT